VTEYAFIKSPIFLGFDSRQDHPFICCRATVSARYVGRRSWHWRESSLLLRHIKIPVPRRRLTRIQEGSNRS